MRARPVFWLGLLAAIFLYGARKVSTGDYNHIIEIVKAKLGWIPRGIKNNNPGNIRYLQPAKAWRGQVGTDGSFGLYDTPANGVRAIGKQIEAYKLDTIAQIISRWAPTSENNTAAYVASVVKHVGVNADTRIDLTSAELKTKLVSAIILHENGIQPYAAGEITQWLAS